MQQINLYLAEFRPSREPLRTNHMAWGLLGVFIVLILVSVYTHQQQAQLQQTIIQAQQAQAALQAQLKILTPPKAVQSIAEVDAEILRLQNQLLRRQRVLAIISSQNLGNDKGFSQQLTALAQPALNTISLETFSLQKGGTYAELSGKARSADQIPLYVKKLREQESFAKVGFGVLNVARDEKQNGLLWFSLAKATHEKQTLLSLGSKR
jgi:hypothetical protein